MKKTLEKALLIEKNVDEKRIKNNQTAYIIQAALEYFVTILVSGSFLAAVLKNIGVSDAITGIVTTLKTLAISMQFFAVLFIKPKTTTKKMVTLMHFINQLMFVVLYLIPYIHISQTAKVATFVIMFLGAEIIYNAAHPFKLSWLNSYVPDNKRGYFTANKEIISLLGGIIFTYLMGALIDHYDAVGKSEIGFALSGVTIFVLCILHAISLLCVRQSDAERTAEQKNDKKRNVKSVLKATLLNKNFSKIIFLDVMWQIAMVTVAFLGTYQITELGFSLTYVALLSAAGSVSRLLFSRPFGRLADKLSWTKMLMLSFGIGGLSYLLLMFACPSNGKIIYALYSVMYGIYLAGSNGGMMNIVFDYVDYEDRPYALGVKSAVGGIIGFLFSLIAARIVSAVQANGNIVFGRTIYAQQILSFMSFVIFFAAVFYIKNVIMKMDKAENKVS